MATLPPAWHEVLQDLEAAIGKPQANRLYRPTAILIAIEHLETHQLPPDSPIPFETLKGPFQKRTGRNLAREPFIANSKPSARFWTLTDPAGQEPANWDTIPPGTVVRFLPTLVHGLRDRHSREAIKTGLRRLPEATQEPAEDRECGLDQLRDTLGQDPIFTPVDLADARKRILTSIVVRQGQSTFREELLEAYSQSCVVTGCRIIGILEAAHIVPYLGPQTNDVTNGLLLRTDIHTLFDLNLLGIHPETLLIELHPSIATEYTQCERKRLAEGTVRPSHAALEQRYREFRQRLAAES